MSTKPKQIRCAIYTRKSTEEGLEQDFNSLDAQREAGEAYIASQKAEGWNCLADRYDDGGYTGGNMERPALQRLMADIEADKIDCVVVYKVDRLSRSLLDFARMMERFEKHRVSFVSVTQHFNTTHSMGRLTLNILLSFAQFEREIISERTRDKIAAARRKGKWSGGPPVLGYDIRRRPGGSQLLVNPDEAERVRRIFELYLEAGSLREAIRRIDQLGWANKTWTTTKGRTRGNRRFDKSALFNLLTNVVYLGKVKHRDQIYEGEHEAIVDEDVFRRVQDLLRRNRNGHGRIASNKYGALLKGLVRCKSCGCGMGHYFSTTKGRRYRYYVCANAQKNGWASCPAPSLPAHELEQFVLGQIRTAIQDDVLIAEAIAETKRRLQEEIRGLKDERNSIGTQAKRIATQIGTAAGKPGSAAALADLQARLQPVELRLAELDAEIAKAKSRVIDEDELVGAIESFEPLWDAMIPRERERMVALLVRQVEFDAQQNTVSVTFNPVGLRTIAEGAAVA